MEERSDRQLRDIITGRIREKGSITFQEFMGHCLYEPGLGYYTSPGRKVGAEGDFYTSSNVHRVFGKLIAREMHAMWQTMGEPRRFDLVEAGAGNGRLAADVMDSLPEISKTFYQAVSLTLVEIEPSLRGQQAEMLRDHREKVGWLDPEEFADGRFTFSGCLYSNELIDSFPVHLVEMTAAGLKEVHVVAQGDELAEVLLDPSTSELGEYLDRVEIRLVPGQRAEINLAALRWLQGAAQALQTGFILTIDYGYTADELYSPARKNGTLICYHRHRIEENLYTRLGLQDMTTHVDFTSLALNGEKYGLRKEWFGEQYRFLLAAGMMEEMMALENSAASEPERLKLRLALKKLILPEGGMGDTFKVLIQSKGVENPRLLSFRDWARIEMA